MRTLSALLAPQDRWCQVDQNVGYDFFLYDRIAGSTALVSHVPSSETASGVLAATTFEPARISADGAWVAFASPTPDLVAGDHNWLTDAFLHGHPFAAFRRRRGRSR